jgi:hypothetical protein
LRRYTIHEPCPVCGGFEADHRNAGKRCWGIELTAVAYCSRPEVAGSCPFDLDKQAYKHVLTRPCRCGRSHALRTRPASGDPHRSQGPVAPIELRDAVYSFLIERLSVRESLRSDLIRRGLKVEEATKTSFRSIPWNLAESHQVVREAEERFGVSEVGRVPGFISERHLFAWQARGSSRNEGFVFCYRDEQSRITGIQMRRLQPRPGQSRYLSPYHGGTPRAVTFNLSGSADKEGLLWLTEGGGSRTQPLNWEASGVWGWSACPSPTWSLKEQWPWHPKVSSWRWTDKTI